MSAFDEGSDIGIREHQGSCTSLQLRHRVPTTTYCLGRRTRITVTVHSTSHQGCNRVHCHRNSAPSPSFIQNSSVPPAASNPATRRNTSARSGCPRRTCFGAFLGTVPHAWCCVRKTR